MRLIKSLPPDPSYLRLRPSGRQHTRTRRSADDRRGSELFDIFGAQRLSELPALENLSELLFDAPSALAQSNSWQGEFKSEKECQAVWSRRNGPTGRGCGGADGVGQVHRATRRSRNDMSVSKMALRPVARDRAWRMS